MVAENKAVRFGLHEVDRFKSVRQLPMDIPQPPSREVILGHSSLEVLKSLLDEKSVASFKSVVERLRRSKGKTSGISFKDEIERPFQSQFEYKGLFYPVSLTQKELGGIICDRIEAEADAKRQDVACKIGEINKEIESLRKKIDYADSHVQSFGNFTDSIGERQKELLEIERTFNVDSEIAAIRGIIDPDKRMRDARHAYSVTKPRGKAPRNYIDESKAMRGVNQEGYKRSRSKS